MMTIIESANSEIWGATPKITPSKSLKEHRARSKKCFDFKPLKDGERLVFASPAFDLRNTEDSSYGQHGVEMNFALRRGNKVATFSIYTGWDIASGHVYDGGGFRSGIMSPGIYTHYKYKKDAGEYASKQEECPFVGKHCYGELGSSLYADVVLARLITEGTAGLWDELEKALSEQP